MGDRFTSLPNDLQDYIHGLKLNGVLTEHYYKKINREKSVKTLAEDIMSEPTYWYLPGSHDLRFLDFNNNHLVKVLSYVSEKLTPYTIEVGWGEMLLMECHYAIDHSLEYFEENEYFEGFELERVLFMANRNSVKIYAKIIELKLQLKYALNM